MKMTSFVVEKVREKIDDKAYKVKGHDYTSNNYEFVDIFELA